MSFHPFRLFTINPPTVHPVDYWQNLEKVIDWSGRHGFSGVLCFTGNDTFVDPWLVAQVALQRAPQSTPLVAVNPLYMHPYNAAKMISSFAYVYRRKVCLNLVIGAALNYLQALGDDLSHDDRYARLDEYTEVVTRLLEGGRVQFSGRFYRLEGAQIVPPVPPELRPELYLAGQSPSARALTQKHRAINMRQLHPALEDGHSDPQGGVTLGIITRPTEAEAWERAHALFPPSEDGPEILELSMTNTDSVWKKQLHRDVSALTSLHREYWLAPFKNFQADSPYLVGSHQRVADLFATLGRRGIRHFILDVPPYEEEFVNIAAALKQAQRQLGEAG